MIPQIQGHQFIEYNYKSVESQLLTHNNIISTHLSRFDIQNTNKKSWASQFDIKYGFQDNSAYTQHFIAHRYQQFLLLEGINKNGHPVLQRIKAYYPQKSIPNKLLQIVKEQTDIRPTRYLVNQRLQNCIDNHILSMDPNETAKKTKRNIKITKILTPSFKSSLKVESQKVSIKVEEEAIPTQLSQSQVYQQFSKMLIQKVKVRDYEKYTWKFEKKMNLGLKLTLPSQRLDKQTKYRKEEKCTRIRLRRAKSTNKVQSQESKSKQERIGENEQKYCKFYQKYYQDYYSIKQTAQLQTQQQQKQKPTNSNRMILQNKINNGNKYQKIAIQYQTTDSPSTIIKGSSINQQSYVSSPPISQDQTLYITRSNPTQTFNKPANNKAKLQLTSKQRLVTQALFKKLQISRKI